MTASPLSGLGTTAVPPKRDPLWDTLDEVTRFLSTLQQSRAVPLAHRDELRRLIIISKGVLGQNGSLETLTAPRGYELALEAYKQCKEIDQMRHGGRGWLSFDEFPGDRMTLVQGNAKLWSCQFDIEQVYLFSYNRVMAWCRQNRQSESVR